MSNVNILLCQNHQKRKAYRYCEECQEFICNSCALQDEDFVVICKYISRKAFKSSSKNKIF